jgi:predicted phosphodiesterase
MKQLVVVISLVTLLFFQAPTMCVQSQNGGKSLSEKNGNATISLTLPNRTDSLRFAVIGDTGTGGSGQRELAERLIQYRQAFPFEFVLMLGDNLYGDEDAKDYEKKFERPYKKLLDDGVQFYAALGNHDNVNQRFYKHFNMDGKEFYSFKKNGVRFFSLNSNYMDHQQLSWLENELKNSGSDWKICFFHHPPYSSGSKHGSNVELRKVIEPLFIKYGVDVAFTGHEHFYERLKPQQGIYYFISGGGGKLREDGVKRTNMTEKSFAQDLHFMLIEIVENQMHFQVISRSGTTIDSGILPRRDKKAQEVRIVPSERR